MGIQSEIQTYSNEDNALASKRAAMLSTIGDVAGIMRHWFEQIEILEAQMEDAAIDFDPHELSEFAEHVAEVEDASAPSTVVDWLQKRTDLEFARKVSSADRADADTLRSELEIAKGTLRLMRENAAYSEAAE